MKFSKVKLALKLVFTALFLNLALTNAYALTSFQLHNIDKVQALGISGQGVAVGIVDGGYNVNHPALKDKFDGVFSNNTSGQYYSHGTFVAGLIGANRTDGEYYGIAMSARLVASGNIVSWGEWWNYVRAHDEVKIVNNSHNGNYAQNKELAKSRQALIVFANDNDGNLNPSNAARQPSYDESLRSWLAVGNLDQSTISRNAGGQLVLGGGAIYNNSGSLCGIAQLYCVMAAGTSVRSLHSGGGLRHGTGTSFSAPAVSGVAALVLEKFPFMNGKQVADVILSTANRDFITPKVVMKGTQVIYIDTAVPTDKAQITKDLTEVYGRATANKANLSTAVSKSKEEVYGQGIVDAYKAINGLSMIDINRLADSDKQTLHGETAAYYALNLGTYDAEFNNDIEQRKWDAKYHTSATSNKPVNLAGLNAGFIKQGVGTLSISGDLQYLGATVVREGAIKLVQKADRAALSVAGNVYVEHAAALNTQGVISFSQSVFLNAGSAMSSQGVMSINRDLVNDNATVTLLNGALIAIGGKYTQQGANSRLVVHFTPDSSKSVNLASLASEKLTQNSSSNAKNSANLASENLNANLAVNSSVNSISNSSSNAENLANLASENLTQNSGVNSASNLANSNTNSNVNLNENSNVNSSANSSANSNTNSSENLANSNANLADLAKTALQNENTQSAFLAGTFDIKGGKLIYVPRLDKIYSSNSVVNVLLGEDLDTQLANFDEIAVDNSSKMLNYTLLEGGKSIVVSTKSTAFLYEGANVSLAGQMQDVLEIVSQNANSPYNDYFLGLSALSISDPVAYENAIKSLDNSSYLSHTEQILAAQDNAVLGNFISLNETSTNAEFSITPRYKSTNLKGDFKGSGYFAGAEFSANKRKKNAAFGGFIGAGMINSDFDNKSELKSKLIYAGFALDYALKSVDILGGVSVGLSQNELEREIYGTSNASAKFKNYSASAQIGLGRAFKFGDSTLNPMILANYTFTNEGEFSESGALFTKTYEALNYGYFSTLAGAQISHKITPKFSLAAHAFYERKLSGDEISQNAYFTDFASEKFEQNYKLAKDNAKIGAKIAYKSAQLSFGVGVDGSVNSRFTSIGAVANFSYALQSPKKVAKNSQLKKPKNLAQILSLNSSVNSKNHKNLSSNSKNATKSTKKLASKSKIKPTNSAKAGKNPKKS